VCKGASEPHEGGGGDWIAKCKKKIRMVLDLPNSSELKMAGPVGYRGKKFCRKIVGSRKKNETSEEDCEVGD